MRGKALQRAVWIGLLLVSAVPALAADTASPGRKPLLQIVREGIEVPSYFILIGSIVVCVDDLKRELKRAIGRLKPSQSFNVILFYSTTGGAQTVKTESFKGKLEAATDDVRKEFFGWIDRKAPQGDTEPLPAIRRALEMKPEVIFFLSDGYFDDTVVGAITSENKKVHAKVFSLVFDEAYLTDKGDLAPKETEGSLRMKRIAEANGGKTKIVTAKDLAK